MEFLTCEEVAKKTGFATTTVWKWIRQKKASGISVWERL